MDERLAQLYQKFMKMEVIPDFVKERYQGDTTFCEFLEVKEEGATEILPVLTFNGDSEVYYGFMKNGFRHGKG